MSLQPREQLAHFLGAKDATTFSRLGKGFAELTNSMAPTTQEKKYIDGSSDSITTSFDVSWAVNGDVYTENDANQLLYDLAYKRAKGDDAVLAMLVAQLWKPGTNNPATDFKGYKQEVTWAPDNSGGGTAEDSVTFSGELKAKGDMIEGWITITKPSGGGIWTATFSETEPDAA